MPNPDLSDSENEEQDDLAGQKDDLAGQKDELVEGSEITDDMFEVSSHAAGRGTPQSTPTEHAAGHARFA